jgi:hypothetical protein
MTRTHNDLWFIISAWFQRDDVRETLDRIHAETTRALGGLITFAFVISLLWAMATRTHVWLLGP